MSTLTADQGLTLPAGPDGDNVPLNFASYNTGVESRLVKRYTSTIDRSARNPTPTEGELSYLLDLNRYEQYTGAGWGVLVPTISSYLDVSTPALLLTTTVTDVPSCSVTFTVSGANAFALTTGVFDFSSSGAAATMFGYLNVDTVDQPASAVKSGTPVDRATVTQLWRNTVAAGSHTFKLRANKDSAVGTMNANAGCTVSVLVVDLP